MIAEELALAKILDSIGALDEEMIALPESRDRFASRDIFARIPLPVFDNSSMDGFAVRAADCVPGEPLRLAGEQPAGLDRQLTLGPGEAIRIFTGAPIPRGADAVIMQEDVRVDADVVLVHEKVERGENIRYRGIDLAAGQKICARGEAITPQAASLLASQGIGEITVARRPTVAIVSTGDELVLPGQPLAPGQLYESNGVLLQMLAAAAGAKVFPLGLAADDPAEIRSKLALGLQHDALLISGGVSVGARDFVKDELKALGVELDVWRVAIKPGKPFLFGRCGACKIFGLPGNPVSSFVTFVRFVRPALLKMAGARDLAMASQQAIALAELRNDGDRPHYLRGKLVAGKFSPFGHQESHALFGLSQSNALARLAPGEKIAEGAVIMVFPI